MVHAVVRRAAMVTFMAAIVLGFVVFVAT